MRYQEIIEFANETQAQRLDRMRLMYSDDDAEERALEADTELKCAKADKLRADALAAVTKVEAEYEELATRLDSFIPTGELTRPG
jgi:hypothetical protein